MIDGIRPVAIQIVADLDGVVDLDDLNTVRNNFGSADGWALGNFDWDTTVDLDDLNIVRNNFGMGGSSGLMAVLSARPHFALLCLASTSAARMILPGT